MEIVNTKKNLLLWMDIQVSDCFSLTSILNLNINI